MSQDSGNFKLGMFVIVAVALIVGAVVLFGSGALSQDAVRYATVTDQSVQGLDVGTAVKLRGVAIGKVSKIQLAAWSHLSKTAEERAKVGRFVLVELAIDPKFALSTDNAVRKRNAEKLVAQGLRARIASSGLTGPPYIELVFLDPEDYPPPELPWTPEGIYIPSAPGTMAQITEGIEEVVEKLRRVEVAKIVERVDHLLATADKAVTDAQVEAIRKDVLAFIDEARGSNQRIKQILDGPEVKALLADLPKISARTNSAIARVDELLHDKRVEEMMANLDTTTAGAAASAGELRRGLRELNGLLISQRQDIAAVVENLRRVLDNAATLTGDAKENPSRMIFGQPPPRKRPGE